MSLFASLRIVELRLHNAPDVAGGKILQQLASAPPRDVLLLIHVNKLEWRTRSGGWFSALETAAGRSDGLDRRPPAVAVNPLIELALSLAQAGGPADAGRALARHEHAAGDPQPGDRDAEETHDERAAHEKTHEDNHHVDARHAELLHAPLVRIALGDREKRR
eukprot:gene50584-68799_t